MIMHLLRVPGGVMATTLAPPTGPMSAGNKQAGSRDTPPVSRLKAGAEAATKSAHRLSISADAAAGLGYHLARKVDCSLTRGGSDAGGRETKPSMTG